MKILWITNMPTLYRVWFFNELGKYCNLTVVFERYHATGVKNKWNDKLAEHFTPIFIDAKSLGRESSFSLKLLQLNLKGYDEIIVSSYSSPAEMLLLGRLKLFKMPYILEVDGGIIKKDNISKNILKRYLISGADLYFSSSDKTTDYLIHYGAKKDKIVKYHFSSLYQNEILEKPILDIEKEQLKKELNIPNKKIVLSVGQFIYRKGYDILLKSISSIKKDFHLIIIGGKVTDEYISICKEYNIKNITFINEISKEELIKYYKASDIFVLPTREDIWGLVINEAMSKGLPIITTNNCISGLELVKDGENGFIVNVENIEELKEKIEILLDNEELCKLMAKNNITKIQNYSLEYMAKEHFNKFLERYNGK